MIDKEALIKTALLTIEQDILKSENILTTTRNMMSETPGVMQSEVSASRFEMGINASKQSKRLCEKREVLFSLQEFISSAQIVPCSKIVMGSAFTVQDGDNISKYLLLPVGSGQMVDFDGCKYCILTHKSPLAVHLMQKSKGDKVNIEIDEPRTIEIVHVT